ncbi:hypothetical protein C8Q78DRAFT_2766 [Trametes maxima]|nr:hypothetical protein C8Q78DRAFT_2766 [Trametes maxima]
MYQDGRELDHLVLDLAHAKPLLAQSNLNSVTFQTQGGKAGPMHNCQESLIAYITKGYFNALQGSSLHVIASFPIFCQCNRKSTIPAYAPKSVRYHILGSVKVTVDNWSSIFSGYPTRQPILYESSKEDLDVVVSLSNSCIPHFPSLGTGFSHGTIAVVYLAFLRLVIVEPLARINARTTLVPEMVDSIQPSLESLKLRT